MTTIDESGMTFGPFPEEDVFQIEKSDTYKSLGESVKIAEFILLRHSDKNPPVVWIVEAKSSSPKPDGKNKFSEYINEINQKLTDTLSLFISIFLQRHTLDKLPDNFQKIDLAKVDFRLVLVIKGHKKDWCPPLKDALQKALQPTRKIWNLSDNSVIVLNDELACKYQLITKSK